MDGFKTMTSCVAAIAGMTLMYKLRLRRSRRPSSARITQADTIIGEDWEEFRSLSALTGNFIADYYRDLKEERFPVRSQVEPGYLQKLLPSSAPEEREMFDAILKDVRDKIMPGITHWEHPSFFSYFPANSSPPGILGDMLSDMFNCIAFSWVASPAATELETIVMDWLAKLLKLPDIFLSSGSGGGVIQGSASESGVVAVLAARQLAVRTLNKHDEDGGILCARLVAYVSDQTHSSAKKAALVAGITADRIVAIETDDKFAMIPAKLEVRRTTLR